MKIAELLETQEYNPSSKLGQALNRALSTKKKLSPVQVQRNKDRWAKRSNQSDTKKDTDFGNYDGWHDAGVLLMWPHAEIVREKGPKGMLSKAYADNRLVGEWDHTQNQGYVMSEGWKSVAANTVAGAALVGAFGGAFYGDHKDTKFTNVDGKEYTQHALPSDMSKVKKTKDDKGNEVYVWIEKSGMKPQYTYYWYAPIKKESK